MRLGFMVCIVLSALTSACLSARGAEPFKDTFDGEKLDTKAWAAGGSNHAVQNVRDGSLRLVTTGQQNSSTVTTKRGDFNFFEAPVTVVWDLIPERTLAGPYPVTDWSKTYASMSLGSAEDGGASASLALTAWPEGFPKPGKDAKWDYKKPHYTLTFGEFMPEYPDHGWAITGVPSRILWTLDKNKYTVELIGAEFTEGDKAKRTGEDKLTEDAFKGGYHLKLFTSSHAKSMEPGVGFLGGVVYTDAVYVTAPDQIPPAPKRKPIEPIPTEAEMLQKILGDKPAESAPPQYLFGMNYAGCTFRPEQGFVPPSAESLDYYKSKGILLMRLPFKWEKLQPKLNGELDGEYVAQMKKTVQMMADRGMKVILDMHNYAQYDHKTIGTADVPLSAFEDAWRRLAVEFKDSPNIWGYGLMNEPVHAKENWWRVAQAGIDGIRKADKNTMIIVAGSGWGGTKGWSTGPSAKLPEQIKDPSKNLCYEGHCYFDHNYSGKYGSTYEYEINRPGARLDPMCGVERIRPFVEWLKKNHCRGLLGEFSVPSNPDRDPRWLLVLDNLCEYLAENNVPSTFWAGGDLWTRERCYVVEPYRGEDRPQMKVLLKHAAKAGK